MASSARIEELEKKFNENPRRYFAPLANEYRKAGDVLQAITICRTYVPQQPAHMSGHIVFGQALFEAGEHAEARTVFEAALALDPENLIALRHLGDIARERGDADAARSWYGRVLDADPRNEEVASLLTALEADAVPANRGPASWADINPERTLELPPDLLESATRETVLGDLDTAPPAVSAVHSAGAAIAFEQTLQPPPPTMPREGWEYEPHAPAAGGYEAGGQASAIDPGGFSFPDDLPTSAAPYTAAASGEPAGFESMEFVPPQRAPDGGDTYGETRDGGMPGSPTGEGPFVTETMAELYLQQGFRDQALDVYRQLVAQNPGDAVLRERVDQLEHGSRSSVAAAAFVSDAVITAAYHRRAVPSTRTVRAFFGELAGRRVGVHEGQLEEDAPPAATAADSAPPAPEAPAEPTSSEAASDTPAWDAPQAAPEAAIDAGPVGEAEAHPADTTQDATPSGATEADTALRTEAAPHSADGTSEPASDSAATPTATRGRDESSGFNSPYGVGPFQDGYGGEFGASGLVPPVDDKSDRTAVGSDAYGADPQTARVSGATDVSARDTSVAASPPPSSGSTEYDVSAFDAGDMYAPSDATGAASATMPTGAGDDTTASEPSANAPVVADATGAAGETAEAAPSSPTGAGRDAVSPAHTPLADVGPAGAGDGTQVTAVTAVTAVPAVPAVPEVTDVTGPADDNGIQSGDASDAAPAAGGTGGGDVAGADHAPRAPMQTGSVNVLFPRHPIAAPDEEAATALAGAFGGPSSAAGGGSASPVMGHAARLAPQEFSLDRVFRDAPAPAAPAEPRREASAFSFDQFFGDTPPGLQSGAAPASDAPLAGDTLDVSSADAEQFSNWLSGLKKK